MHCDQSLILYRKVAFNRKDLLELLPFYALHHCLYAHRRTFKYAHVFRWIFPLMQEPLSNLSFPLLLRGNIHKQRVKMPTTELLMNMHTVHHM